MVCTKREPVTLKEEVSQDVTELFVAVMEEPGDEVPGGKELWTSTVCNMAVDRDQLIDETPASKKRTVDDQNSFEEGSNVSSANILSCELGSRAMENPMEKS